jgi:photosystem II stability/assembly factor-like uncharacterized protein
MRRLALVLVALALGHAAPAAANGRMPATSTVHFRPGSTSDIYVGATWGLLFTKDGGATWRWVCEQAVGYGGEYDPDYAVTRSGALWATTLTGLRTTTDGCVWESTRFGELLVSQVAIGPDDSVWVSTADAAESKVYRSTDGGRTFDPTGTTRADANSWWESIETTSNPDITYLAGYRNEGGVMVLMLLRTDNGGRDWSSLSTAQFATTGSSFLQIAAVSPDDPGFLFARITRPPGGTSTSQAIYRSTNAGATWTLVKMTDDIAPGVVVRHHEGPVAEAKNRAEVIIGTTKAGTFRSTDGGVTFVPVPRSLEVQCLAERPEDRALFACGNNLAPDNMALARSDTPFEWTSILEFRNVTAPAACGDGTVQKLTCQDEFWCGFKKQLGIASEVVECPADGDAAVTPQPPKKKGGCDASDGAAVGTMVVIAAVLLGVGVRRRRRRVSSAGQTTSDGLY